MEPTTEEAAQLERSRFVIVPFELVEQCADRKGTLLVFCRLWHYAGAKDAAYPSAARLSADCRMKRDAVFDALAWLEAEGWVRRETRPGQTTLYHVRTENPSPKRGASPKRGPSPKRGVPPVPHMGDTNKNQLTRTNNSQETPTPLEPETTKPAPIPRQHPDSVVRSESPRKAPVDPYASKTLPGHLVPDDLLELQQLLPEWWAVKKGVRSQGVFNRVCRRLRIWDHEQRIDALERAISGGWADLYEPRASAGSSSPGNRLQLPLTGADVARRFFTLRSAS